MIKVIFLEPSSIKYLFFESSAETYNWLKNINTQEKDIYVDHKFVQKEFLNISLLKTAKEILVQAKLIGA